MWRLLFVLLCLSATLEAVGLRVATFNVGAAFEDGDFIHGIGDPGTPDHDRVLEVLSRIDADVVALQEIHFRDVSGTPDDVDALAAALGLPFVHVATSSGATDFRLRVAILSRYAFLETKLVRSPAGATELARLMPAAKVDVPDTDFDPWVVASHIKSGSSSTDRFRKAIELQRLAGFLSAEGLDNEDPFVLLGDFNLGGSDRSFSEADFATLDLPNSYDLGDDITFPVFYDNDLPAYFSEVQPLVLDALQLNGDDATFRSGSVLDLIAISPGIAARPFRSEVYNSVLDTSNDTGLVKQGNPLDEEVSDEASDHFAVFADLELSDPEPYRLAVGSPVMEDFERFDGGSDPAPWTSGGATWVGVDDGSSQTVGARSYGDGVERAPGFVLGAMDGKLEATFVNESAAEIRTLDLSYMAEQWRSAFEGSRDRIEVELIHEGVVTRLETLDYEARRDLVDGAIPGGLSSARSARLIGLAIPVGGSFDLRFRFVGGDQLAPPPAEVFVNEFHYDNAGTDEGEFVEIVVGPGYAGALADVSFVLYNGRDGESITSFDLTTFVRGETTSSGHRIFSRAIPGIQNGAPDGFAVVVEGQVESFQSYEGSFVATDGPAVGLSSVDLGVAQTSSEPAGEAALGLVGVGGGPGSFMWERQLGVSHSPGRPNQDQSFELSGLPAQGLAIDDVFVAIVADRDGDGLADSEDPDDDNDAQSDEFELAFGTDPLDPDSKFTTSIEPGTGGNTLVFPGAEGIRYTIEWSTSLSGWGFFAVREGTGTMIEVDLPADEPRAFFRVRAGE